MLNIHYPIKDTSKCRQDIILALGLKNTFVTHPHKYLSDIKPEDEEDKEAEEEEVVDVIVAVRLQQLPHLPYSVFDDRAGAVEPVVHVVEQCPLILQLHPNVDGERLELGDLVLHVALHLLILVLQRLMTHYRALGVPGHPRAPVGHGL